MIELGGNITLDGFESCETAKIIVIKKIVGNYVKNLQESGFEFSALTVQLQAQKDTQSITASLTTTDKKVKTSTTEGNLFFALDKVLKDVQT